MCRFMTLNPTIYNLDLQLAQLAAGATAFKRNIVLNHQRTVQRSTSPHGCLKMHSKPSFHPSEVHIFMECNLNHFWFLSDKPSYQWCPLEISSSFFFAACSSGASQCCRLALPLISPGSTIVAMGFSVFIKNQDRHIISVRFIIPSNCICSAYSKGPTSTVETFLRDSTMRRVQANIMDHSLILVHGPFLNLSFFFVLLPTSWSSLVLDLPVTSHYERSISTLVHCFNAKHYKDWHKQ